MRHRHAFPRERWVAVIVAVGLAGVMLGATSADAQVSRCGACHLASPGTPAEEHVFDWEHSAHGRASVGCEACHGGDPMTVEPQTAHDGVLPSQDPASPVHRFNIPDTCGECHQGPFTEFQKSEHFGLLSGGDESAPTCLTCHGAVAGNRPSPGGLESRCRGCHGPDGVAPREHRPADAREMLEGVRHARMSLRVALWFIERIEDGPRRALLQTSYDRAEAPIDEAVVSGHAFVFDTFHERLALARERITDLLEQLVNPR